MSKETEKVFKELNNYLNANGSENMTEEYLKFIAKRNKDLKKFFKAITAGNLEKYAGDLNNYGYRPFSIEELITQLMENTYLFETNTGYIILILYTKTKNIKILMKY